MQVPPETGEYVADDGCRLHYQIFGPATGRTILFANGLGVDFPGLRLQLAALATSYRVVCWDYRGVGLSEAPKSSRGCVLRHALDALALLDYLGIRELVVVGWSLGVPVGLELCRLAERTGARIQGFVALLGRARPPTIPQSFRRSLDRGLRCVALAPGMVNVALMVAQSMPLTTIGLLKRVGFVGSTADPAIFFRSLRSVVEANRRIYLQTLASLLVHDASDALSHLACPTLFVTGTKDILAMPDAIRCDAQQHLNEAQVCVVQGGSHFAMIEQPDRVNMAIIEFLDATKNETDD